MTDPVVDPGTPPNGGNPNPNPNPAPDKPFYDGFKDADTKAWLGSFAPGTYPDAESVAVKAYNLEKFVGADKAGRGIVVPKDLSKIDELIPVFRKLGAAETIDGYKVDPKVEKDPVISKLREHAHKIGMPVQHFNSTVALLTEVVKSAQDSQTAQLDKTAEEDLLSLRTEWIKPGEYDKQVELGRRAAKMFIPHESADQLEEVLTKMEGAVGTKFMMKLWAAIGGGLAEHSFVDDVNRPSGGMTPEGARVRINELKSDKEFGKKLLAGGQAERNEWDRLHKIAAIETPAAA